MKRAIVIGSPGAGKSTFARALHSRTGLPLIYLDLVWHRPDKTTVSRHEFDRRLAALLERDRWIMDGNYTRTLATRLARCDTVFLLDYPVEECLAGIRRRLGHKRVDLPWIEEKEDPEFMQYVRDFPASRLPLIEAALREAPQSVHRFRSRREADQFLASIPQR